MVKWFKHDSDASFDAKLRKVIMRYGTDGYAIYFHCLELICGSFSRERITFELEHDSEIIADNLKVKSRSDKSAIDVVQEIMKYMVTIGLFESSDDRIFCTKMLKRFDSSMTSDPQLRKVITDESKNHDPVMIKSRPNHDSVMQEEKRKEEKRKEEKRVEERRRERKRTPTLVLGSFKNVRLTDEEYERLVSEEGKGVVDSAVEILSCWKEEKGKISKNDNLTIRRWCIKAAHERRAAMKPRALDKYKPKEEAS